MLTVKQITLSGIEYLWEAVNVGFQPRGLQGQGVGNPTEPQPAPDANCVLVTTPTDDCVHVYGGTVFVMNDKGKTVSRYDLGASNVPLNNEINPHLTAQYASLLQGDVAVRKL